MACRSQTILSSLFQGRSTFKPAPVKEKSSIRQVPSAILPILNYRDPLYPHFHVSIVNQVSPYCDCHAENDAAVVPDIGMFASFDPVALDHACIDAVNAAPAISTSVLGQCAHEHNDHFTDIHPKTNWRSQIEHARKIGIGNVDYELVTVK